MKCNKCHVDLFEGAMFCHKCGEKAQALCSSCNRELVEGAIFCPYCGAKAYEDLPKLEQVSRIFSKPEEIMSDKVNEDWFANDKSMYIPRGRDFNRAYYQGMIYFLSISANEVWKMYEDGTNLEFVVKRDENDDNQFIGVNRRGIFTYGFDNQSIYNYSFEGELINKAKLKIKDGYFHNEVIIVDDKIYYSTNNNDWENLKQEVLSIGIDGLDAKLIYRGNTKKEVLRILANNTSVFLYIRFHGAYETTEGWYKQDLKTEELINLNSVIRPPHETLTHPKRFDSESRSFIEDNDWVEIFSFDFVNNIMWTTASRDEARQMNLDDNIKYNMIFPRKIGLGPNQPILDEEAWILPERYHIYRFGDYIFNGDNLYYLQNYYTFYEISRDGSKSEDWNKSNHGRVETMQLLGNSLIGDLFADYIDFIYPINIGKPEYDDRIECGWETPLRKD